MTRPDIHLPDDRLDAFARYEPRFGPPALDDREQAHLAACADCRARLDAIDPAAVLGLLGWLPEEAALPPFPQLPERSRRGRPAIRLVAGLAAAALVAALALVMTGGPPEGEMRLAEAFGERAETWPGIVRSVESETATVVTLVPPGSDGPTVTLILDEGLDL